jgi:glycosyltransferase involved in cell wall biosynthesis
MKKIAFIKFAGMASGGIEKYLQTIAILLKKQGHCIDFYYTNAAPFTNGWKHPENSDERKKFVELNGVNTIQVNVDYKIGEREPYEWVGTNFWDVFDEKQYDFIQTGRGGYPEYPFNLINNCSIIDSIHSFTGEDKPNIKKAILLCNWQAEKWGSSGGNIKKAEIIPSIVYVPEKKQSTLRKVLNIPEDMFIYGFHQANRDDIFSPVSLLSYAQVQNDKTCFVILGGSQQHVNLAKQLNLKNIYFLEFTSSTEDIHDFLSGIDVFAHARSDGEVCSASIIEAMYHGKPVISHPALNMGHAEQIDGCGKVCNTIQEYVSEMNFLKDEIGYYSEKSEKTLERYNQKYNYKTVEKSILDLYNNIEN